MSSGRDGKSEPGATLSKRLTVRPRPLRALLNNQIVQCKYLPTKANSTFQNLLRSLSRYYIIVMALNSLVAGVSTVTYDQFKIQACDNQGH